MRQVYLDYSATTPVKKQVLDEMIPYFSEKFGNPSSLYEVGASIKADINIARERVAQLIHARPEEIYFTSCGTEADNWALISTARKLKSKGNHIITSKIEHHAILHSCEFLAKEGFEITYLDVDQNGFVRLDQLEKAIKTETILISIMFANNEIGTIQPIEEIGKIAKKNNVLFHTDAVQALGNVKIHVKELGVDMLSMSAHKIYGPKGVGALYIRKGLILPNFMNGGAQENKRRAGTENTAGVVGFGKAAQLSLENLEHHIQRITELRNYFIQEVMKKIPYVYLNGDQEKRLPGNSNLTFEYIEGEAMLLYLDMHGISVSTGSACSSASLVPSHVLDAIGIPIERIHGSLRFTIGDFTTKEDIDYTVEVLVSVVERLRAMSPVSKEKGW
ncbi:MAG: cysteine desulfurase NifS [Anaerovorax sp.]